ncbi:hypothetical protein ACQFX9_25810 [Aliinostoc sp. HNIBRCY26]|uniref:hypothetical protein n=1 Tax=Aliinostoc sp. HNIBRCY26 TaxID=3418997 RepID=UPI003D02B894
MTLPYSTQAGKIAYQEATALWRAINFRAGDFKALRGLNADLKQLSSIRTGARAATNPISNAYRKLEFDIGSTNKKVSGIQRITDSLKKGAFKEINPRWGIAANTLLQVVQAGITILAVKSAEEIQAIDLRTGKRTEADLQNAFTRSINNSLSIRNIREQIARETAKINKDLSSQARAIFDIKTNTRESQKKANDALYEVRAGRKILEDRINQQIQSSNAKVQELATRFNTALGNTTNNAQNAVKNAIDRLQKQVAELQKPSAPNQEIPKLQQKVDTLFKTVETIPQNLKKVVEINADTTKKVVDAAFRPLQQAQEKWGVTITPSQVNYPTINYSTGGIIVPTAATVTPAQVRFGQFSSSDLGQQARVLAQDEAEKVEMKVNAVNGRLSTGFQQIEQARNLAEAALREAKIKGVPVNTIEIENRVKEQESRLTTGLNNVNSRIGNFEKVNEQGNRKLDDLLGKVNSIIPVLALIPAKAAQAVRQDMPSVGDIEAATGRAMCRNLQTGCGRQAIDDAVGNVTNNVNQHNTNNTGNVLDAINTGANAALLQGQQTILQRLGDQLPGGIGGKLTRFSDWLKLDRVLNVLTTAATVHNAFMLSNDIGQTLLGIINNVLQLIGLKDDNGQPFDIGSIISSTIENFIKSIVGADNYQTITIVWAKANRIYQATTNVLNSFLSLSQLILQANELIAAYTGKIGNALKRGGVVLENAYGWMNPQPKFNRVSQFLENVQNAASTVQMVTQIPLDIANATTELANASTEFVNAVKEDDKPENKANNTPEPEVLKAQELLSKNNSQPTPFDFSDLFDGED